MVNPSDPAPAPAPRAAEPPPFDAQAAADKAAAFRACKGVRKLACLTAYDYPMARLLDEAGLDCLLVGDSLGMVVLGYEDTTLVRLEEIEHHLRAVRRGTKNALVVGDLPYQTYLTPEQAAATALRLAAAGAEAVKLEGGTRQADKVRAIVEAGIPAMGHLGMLPQRVREEGGYKKKGKTRGDAEQLLQGARDLERAGVFAIVLESMVAEVAEAITREVSVPTIGIGAGQATDGQVLVVHDLIGGFPWFRPKFAMVAADIATEIRRAADEYRRAVIEG